jgi:hypothetical protein
MAISYIHRPTGDKVRREDWRWVAQYDDGSKLEQFAIEDTGPVFHNSTEIDVSRLETLQLVHDTFPPITIDVPKDASVVFFWRRTRSQTVLHGQTQAEDQLVQERRYKHTFIGFRKDRTYWLACVDDYNHVTFTSNKDMFVEET